MFSIYKRKYSKKYDTHKAFHDGLQQGEDAAWTRLAQAIIPYVEAQGYKHNLLPQKVETLHADALAKHLECFGNGSYQFDGNCPSRFTFKIVGYLVKQSWRKKNIAEWDEAQHCQTQDDAQDFENRDFIEKGFENLTEKEQRVWKQTYKEGYSDEELIAQPDALYRAKPALRKARERVNRKIEVIFRSLWLLLMLIIH